MKWPLVKRSRYEAACRRIFETEIVLETKYRSLLSDFQRVCRERDEAYEKLFAVREEITEFMSDGEERCPE